MAKPASATTGGVRLRVYVDGFNLYHRALRTPRAADGSTYKWLDLEKLVANALGDPQYAVDAIRFFTARVLNLPSKPHAQLRQTMYLRALGTLTTVTIHYGYFQRDKKKMQLVAPLSDGTTHVKVHKFEEKGSDVNLATFLLTDAFQSLYDVAAVVTNDSDLAEPIRIVRTVLQKPVIVLDPCGTTNSIQLKAAATFYKPIRLGAITASLFNPTLADAQGTFHKPNGW